jgi:hypothetical protein
MEWGKVGSFGEDVPGVGKGGDIDQYAKDVFCYLLR